MYSKFLIANGCRAFLCAAVCVCAFLLNQEPRLRTPVEGEEEEEGKAWGAMEWWYAQRSYPNELIPHGAFARANSHATKLRNAKATRGISSLGPPPWRSLGPNNVAGRILSLAIDPVTPDIIWAGSAGGGLWKSTTRGAGPAAWMYVNTGYPSMAVSTIAIDPVTPSVMYAGTGEISLYRRPLIGISGARASYGMGILKSTDSGNSWNITPLTFAFPEITAIQKIVINPLNHSTIFAATSEGTYRSTNGGSSWMHVHTVLMAMDIVLDPVDTTNVFVACGNLNSSEDPGLYKSSDAGSTWNKLAGGLPSSNFGRTSLAISPANHLLIVAGIANASTSGMHGLYKSTDGGTTWSLATSTNYAGSQGWYNNAVALHPLHPETLFCSGIDLYKSVNGGLKLSPRSNWMYGFKGVLTPGGNEGPPEYMHADHHAILFDPTNPRTMYFGTDGGVFASTDGGETFSGRNGGLVTAQFYPGFAVSSRDSVIALGGLQDNGVLKYSGIPSWGKVDGGDGGWCAIDAGNPNVMFDEYIYLSISRSTNGGASFSSSSSGLTTGPSVANFIAPFVMAPSNSSVLYAGAKSVLKSTNSGSTWFSPAGGVQLNGTSISCLGVSWSSPDTLMAATGTGALGASTLFQLFASTNGGSSWRNVTGSIPPRYITDIMFSPENGSTVYVTLSGFGTGHIFKSTTLGESWSDISGNLPDIPHQAVAVDPGDPQRLYVGTDLGVFHSSDDGAHWEDYNDGMPPAMVMDLVITESNSSLRAVTFGSGAWERYLKRSPELRLLTLNSGEAVIAGEEFTIRWDEKYIETVGIDYSPDDGLTWSPLADGIPASAHAFAWSVPVIETRGARIRIRSEADGALSDASDSVFAVLIDPDILPGWNLLSVPFDIVDNSSQVVFPGSISKAYRFEVNYRESEVLQSGSGYWLKFEHPQNMEFAIPATRDDTILLHAGWNLIGSIGRPFPVDSIQQEPADVIVGNIFGFDGGYFIADTLQPGIGYWVKSASEGRLFLGELIHGVAFIHRDRFPKRL
jgi:photosystem II stability/assembly factor-like uncharacterized protein